MRVATSSSVVSAYPLSEMTSAMASMISRRRARDARVLHTVAAEADVIWHEEATSGGTSLTSVAPGPRFCAIG